jgi:sigma-B regulation protein RsbU (phosphoserine phosphatase)
VAEPLKTYDPRHGPALGLFEKSTYPVGRCPMAVNDLIVLFTDGLYEVAGPDNEEFGEERLREAVRKHAQLPAEQLFAQVLDTVRAFTSKQEFEDDVCLVALEAARLGHLNQAGGGP